MKIVVAVLALAFMTAPLALAQQEIDADSIHTAHRGIATGLVSVASRYMHSPNEMVDLEDLENAAKLMAGFARRVTAETDFVPQ